MWGGAGKNCDGRTSNCMRGGENVLEQEACILWRVRDGNKTLPHQPRGKEAAQEQCAMMTLERGLSVETVTR